MVVAAVTAAALLAALVGAAPAAAQPPAPAGFSDVSPGSHKPAIDALDQMGVFEGTLCGENRFCPSSHIDRSTVAVWLIRVLESGDPPDTDASGFADVDSDQWWAPFVERIADLEITEGCKREPLRYCPDELVTRARMATFLVRAFDLDPADPAGFVDIAGSTHEANINALAAAKLTVGCEKDPAQLLPQHCGFAGPDGHIPSSRLQPPDLQGHLGRRGPLVRHTHRRNHPMLGKQPTRADERTAGHLRVRVCRREPYMRAPN